MSSSVSPSPSRSLFCRLESRSFADVTAADDLGTVGLVALLEASSRLRRGNTAADRHSDTAGSAAAYDAAASTPAVAAAAGDDDSQSAAHLFALLSRYPQQCNRIARYMELDSNALWVAVRRHSKFALHSSEAERVEHDSISFERGDSETRVRLVLTELRHVAHALRRQQSHKLNSSNEQPAGTQPAASASASSSNLPTPQKSIALSRASSLTPLQQLPLPSTAAPAAPSFCSPLLTHPLFADELSHILPVLFLRCSNESGDTSGLTDEEDEHGHAHDRDAQVNLTERFARGAASPAEDDDEDQQLETTETATRRTLFMPLRDLVHVLLHQGPVHAPRFLTLLAFAKPNSLPAILDACFDLLRAQISCVHDKLHASSQNLPSLMRDPQLLSKGVLRLWRQSFLLMHSAPFPGLYASLQSLAGLDLPHTALGVRLRVMQMMDQIKLTPPTLALPPLPLPSQPMPAAASAAATALASAAAPAPSGPLSTPVRLRAPPLPPPLTAQASAARPVTPLFNATASTLSSASPSASPAPAAASATAVPGSSASSASAAAAVSIATPTVLASLLSQCWSPLSHYLPRLSLGVTLQLLRDPVSLLTSIVARANAPAWTPKVSDAMAAADESLDPRSSSAHRVLEYLRDHRLSEEYSDLIGPAMQAAHQATVNAAANAAAQKEKSRLAAEAAAPPVRVKKKSREQRARQRAKEAAAAALAGQQIAEQPPADTQSAPSKVAPSTPLSNRASVPSTSPSLSAHKSSGSQIHLVPALTSNSPQRNAQLHAGFSSPTLHSMQYKEVNGAKAHTQQPRPAVDFLPPLARSSVEAALSLYRSGSVDHLRVQLFARLQLLCEQHAQQFAQIRQHGAAAISSVCSELTRLVQLYCQLMLHCQFYLRTRELQLVHQLIPPVDEIDEALAIVSSAPALLAVVPRLHQFVLAVLCICPVPTGSSSTCGWQVSLQTLLRLKRWMAAMHGVAVQRAASRADAAMEGGSNLLLQFGIAAQHSKASEINYLLRALLRLPLSFKPALLHPHSISSHLREMQMGLLQAHVWPKFEVLPEVFSLEWIRPDGSGPVDALLRRDEHGMLHLRSSSLLLARALFTRIEHAYHLLRPTPVAVQSLVPRPYFEFGVGFWLSSLLRITTALDPAVPSLSLFLSHPLLCHSSILPLLDSVAQFDLSAAILEQQQAQSHGQVRPAQQRRDQRAIKEEEMRDMLHVHCHNDAAATRSLPCVPDLRNPIGLILCVYYLLSYNSLAFQLSWKCLPAAPDPHVRSLLDGNDEHEDAEQVTAPDAPFTPALAQSISIASAVAPYPPHLYDGLPLRGILEFIKRLQAHSKKQGQQRAGTTAAASVAVANVSSLYVSLHRLLLQLHPESLIGFDVSCEPESDMSALQSSEMMRTEGAILAITDQEQTTLTMPDTMEEERSSPMSPTEIIAAIAQPASLQLDRALHALELLISASIAPLSSYAESFLLHVLRPLCRSPSSPLHSSVERVWLSFYSSGLSSSEFVARTLHCLLVDVNETASACSTEDAWTQFQPSAMDPMQLLLLAPSRVLCAPSLFRVLLICLYHCLVSSTSYFAVLGKSEYVSVQLLTQSLHHSTHAGWTMASKLLAPTPNPHERKSCKEVEPMTLYIHAHVDKIIAAQQHTQGDASKKPPPSLQRELTPTSVSNPSPPPVFAAALASEVVPPSDRPPSKKQRLQDPSSSSDAHAIKNEDDQADGEQKNQGETHRDAMRDTMTAEMEETTSSAPAASTSAAAVAVTAAALASSSVSCSSSFVSHPPRPYSFLVSDRVLSPGEQLIFSADFALAMPPMQADVSDDEADAQVSRDASWPEDEHDADAVDAASVGHRAWINTRTGQSKDTQARRESPAAPDAHSSDPLSTPTLRVFAYLLTTRAAIAQRLLDHALSLLRTVPLPTSSAASAVSCLPSPAVLCAVSRCVSLVFSFLGLLFRASSPPSSSSPSSLLLLLHVQSYPCGLLPLFCTHFESQLRPLMQAGPLRDRIQAGVGETSKRDTAARRKFMDISTKITMQQHNTQQQGQGQGQQSNHRQEKEQSQAQSEAHQADFSSLLQLQSQHPRSSLLRDWLRTAMLFPRLAPLITAVAQQMQQSDATLF